MPLALLEQTTPFRFLSDAERRAVAGALTPVSFAAGQTIIVQGAKAADDDAVYLLASGSVETVDRSVEPPLRVGTISAGHYFGERAALFGEPRRFEIRAIDAVRCYCLTGSAFLELVRSSSFFASALARILRDKQGVFTEFEEFLGELRYGVALGELNILRLLPRYVALDPAIHSRCRDANAIDFAALSYAVRRLPRNVTSTLSFFLTDDLPAAYADAARMFQSIPTDARPRTVYQMMPGKSMIVLRDGLSDLVDFVTCLCVLAVEGRKIRKRLGATGALAAFMAAQPSATVPATDSAETLASLAFSADEAKNLVAIWPESTAERLYELAVHHEDFAMSVRKQKGNYNSRHSEQWTAEIGRATKELLGCDPTDLPAGLRVHVISSNTHSVINCLNPFVAQHAEAIRAWGVATGHADTKEQWPEPLDLAYALSHSYFRAHPEADASRVRAEMEHGILRLRETAFTGIHVQLIDTSRLAAGQMDARLPAPKAERSLIVNIDFAFGEQADEIIACLLLLFGRSLASVNVLGKAGGLQGRRGDVLVPTTFIEQQKDVVETVHQALDIERLKARVPDRNVWVGPLLTVAGTLLQNSTMLSFYRHLGRCVGLEMEGYFYHRELLDARHLGLIPDDVKLRFLYYVSDLPLDTHSTLAGRMSAVEGVPPLYAVTREILASIFEQ